MLKKLLAGMIMLGLAFSVAMPVRAQEAKKDKAPKQDRWEGVVTMISKDKGTIKVRKIGSHDEKVIAYDSSTAWGSQEHGSKTVNKIDISKISDGDRVICVGKLDKDGVLHATTISKRLTP